MKDKFVQLQKIEMVIMLLLKLWRRRETSVY